MASANVTLADDLAVNHVYALASTGENSAEWRDQTNGSNAYPCRLTQKIIMGEPGQRGSNRIRFSLSFAKAGTTHVGVVVPTATLEVTLPRDAAVTTANLTALIHQIGRIPDVYFAEMAACSII